MKFRVEIDCDNDAFENNTFNEVARILETQASKLRRRADSTPEPAWGDTLRDTNGNRVGYACCDYEKEE